MTGEERLDILTELLRTTQVVRKNAMGNEGRMALNGAFREVYDRAATDEEAERLLADMFPWVFGPKSIMEPLIAITSRRSPPTGMDMYNILVIVHRLDKTGILLMGYKIYSQLGSLPEPDVRMCMDLGG